MCRIFKLIIKSYQKISQALFPSPCRFYPTCSQYAIEAIEKYGFFRGMVKFFIRIIKCSPFSQGGYDPLR